MTINELTDRRIAVLDGAMGTMIQRLSLSEPDFRINLQIDEDINLKGNNDLLCLSQPDAILDIHRRYIAAGADIISTNSFNANAISQADYHTESLVRDINLAAARLGRKAADEELAKTGRKIFVAGSVGPTNRSASMSPKIDDPACRNVTYAELRNAYSEQVEALIEGGCDLILFETVFDTLNLKAGLDAVELVSEQIGNDIPVMVSASIADKSGRILSGQTISALWASIRDHRCIFSFGLNCSWGATNIKPFIADVSGIADGVRVSCHPNAGLPDEQGRYSESPEKFAADMAAIMTDGSVNIVGGCCGTTPEHIAALKAVADKFSPRTIPPLDRESLQVSGLDLLKITPAINFVNIGERCNVAGSRKFLRLINEKNYTEALDIARKQVDDGAQIIDINMDDALLDAKAEMTRFVRLIGSDPDIARVPLMIDSSQWDVILAGLENSQGKCIVNSISLKEGEATFIAHARDIKRHDAAVVVMAFDEIGQADTLERRIEICRRSYDILTKQAGIAPSNIIFDPNIMAVGTGIESHDSYARDFIATVKWIKAHLPGARVSGGVSNLSFAFRGNNPLREAMHAVFLYHAIAAGMDMAIVNPATKVTYDDIEPALRANIEALLLNAEHSAAEALTEYAQANSGATDKAAQASEGDRRCIPVDERLIEAIVKGRDRYIDEDIDEAISLTDKPLLIIEGPLMAGLNKVGELFADGKMFLPQVIKSARAMKLAVSRLKPVLQNSKQYDGEIAPTGTVLIATVKGDVHDIGKNIVATVLECNNYKVIDLGVMVPPEQIIEQARIHRPDIICLSGLITPSLGEMVIVADKLEESGLDIPLIVGGATTSKLHTALKIAPRMTAPVIHAADASQNPIIAAKLLNRESRIDYMSQIANEYATLRSGHESTQRNQNTLPIDEARALRLDIDWTTYTPTRPKQLGAQIIDNIDVADVRSLIDWSQLYHAWRLVNANADKNDTAAESLKLKHDAEAILNHLSGQKGIIKAIIGSFEANSANEMLTIDGIEFPMLRQQKVGRSGRCLSVADFVMPAAEGRKDYVGAFAVAVAGPAVDRLAAEFEAQADKYSQLLLHTLLDRLAEATAQFVARQFPEAIRPAFGYPMMPDQLLNITLSKLLPMSEIGITMTESGAMSPSSSVSGLLIMHPDAQYFIIEHIGDDQLADYASHRGISIDRLRSALLRYL